MRTIRVQCALKGCFKHFDTDANKPRSYCTTEHARLGGQANSVRTYRKKMKKPKQEENKAREEDLAEMFSENPCPNCSSSLDYDGNVVFCTDRDGCGWSMTVAQIKRDNVFSGETEEGGGEKDEEHDDLRVGEEENKRVPGKAGKKSSQRVAPVGSVAGHREVFFHVGQDTPTLSAEEAVSMLSGFDPDMIRKISNAALSVRKAFDSLHEKKE